MVLHGVFSGTQIPLVREAFSYDKWKSSSSRLNFRLLTLNPATAFDADIHCHLKAVPFPLEEGQEYDALSYVWGNSAQRRTIYVGGFAFGVTPNLETALRYFRYPDKSRVLWVDAVCR